VVGHYYSVSTFPFGAIESSVSVTEQWLGRLTILGENSRSDRDRNAAVHVVIELRTETCNGFANPLGAVESSFGSDVGQNDREFFTAIPADKILGSYAGAEGMSDLFENGVSGGVAELVVQFLEVIDIDHQDGEGSVASIGACEFALEGNLEKVTIEQACKAIANGLVLQFFSQIEGGKRHCGELDKLANAFGAVFNHLLGRFVGATDVEDSDRVAMSDERNAEITARGGCYEVITVDLRCFRSAPAEMPRTQAAASLGWEDLGYAETKIVNTPTGYSLDHISRTVDDAERAIGAREQLGETECRGAMDLMSIRTELQVVAGDRQKLRLAGMFLEPLNTVAELLICLGSDLGDVTTTNGITQKKTKQDHED